MKIVDVLIRALIAVESLTAWLYVMLLLRIDLASKVKFRGFPSIYAVDPKKISIGSGTIINSKSYRYHVTMYSACKLLADSDVARINIGRDCRIHGTCIHAVKSISIGSNVLMAGNCQIMDSNAHDLLMNNPIDRLSSIDSNPQAVLIEDNVWLGANVIVLPGVTIGEGSVIGAGSVVSKNIPPNVVAAGNPIRIIRSYG